MLDSDAAGSRADERRKEGTEGLWSPSTSSSCVRRSLLSSRMKPTKDLTGELANLREHYAHHGLLVSSSRAQAVMDAALLFRCSISQRKGPSSSSPGG